MKEILAWHFLQEARCLRYSPYTPIEAGKTYHVRTGTLDLCAHGLHASINPLDAIDYAPGPILCRVALSGLTIHGADKLCSRHRRVIWMADATRTLHIQGLWVANQLLTLHKSLLSGPAYPFLLEYLAAGLAKKQLWMDRAMSSDTVDRARVDVQIYISSYMRYNSGEFRLAQRISDAMVLTARRAALTCTEFGAEPDIEAYTTTQFMALAPAGYTETPND